MKTHQFCYPLLTRPRYLSDGHSVRLGVEHHDSPTGFWRLRVYLTPTGD